MTIAGDDGERGAQKIGSRDRVGLLRFAALNQFNDLVHVLVRRAKPGDRRSVLLDQAKQRNVGKIRGNADFDERFGLVLFRGIELREARPEKMGLQKVTLGADRALFDLIFNEPNFRAVVLGSVANQEELEERLVGLEIDGMMKLGNQWAKFFEEGDTDLFEVLFDITRTNVARICGGDMGDIPVEANGPGLRRNLPLGGAKEDGNMARVDGSNAWRHRL